MHLNVSNVFLLHSINKMRSNYCIIVFLLFCVNVVFAQKNKDTLVLKQVDITAPIINNNKGYELNNGTNFIQNIIARTPYFVKQNSPGMLSTLSIRGSTASQINTTWNGIKINDAMLGQNDFGLIQGALFGNSNINESAQSTHNIGGAGGSVNLLIADSSLYKLYFSTAYTTFNNTENALQLRMGKQRLKSFTHINYNYMPNVYTYFVQNNSNDSSAKQRNAKASNVNVYEQLSYTRLYCTIKTSLWYTYNKRTIPPTTLTTNQRETQQDSSLRWLTSVDFNMKNNQTINASLAAMNDGINYQNVQQNIKSINLVRTTALLLVYNKTWAKYNQALSFTNNNYAYNAFTNNYASTKHQYENSLIINYSAVLGTTKLSAQAGTMFFNYAYNPIIASVSIQGSFFKTLNYKANVGNNYRFPTLNDRYWNVGLAKGNLKLQPEFTNYAELKLNCNLYASKKITTQIGIDPYYKTIKDLILWTPNSANVFTPANIKNVQQYGYDAKVIVLVKFNKTSVDFAEFFGYNKSIVSQSTVSNDASVGKQLIYSPILQLKSNVTLYIGNHFYVNYSNNYTHWRATSTDNFSYLPAYAISNCSANYNFKIKQALINCGLQANNVFNANYAVVAYRPQPLRNYILQVSVGF
jgi:vitamin B12 transporter